MAVELNDLVLTKPISFPKLSIFDTVKQSDLGASVGYYFDRKEY